MSQSIKALINLNKLVIFPRNFGKIRQLSSRDITKQNAVPATSPDYLLQNLKTAVSVKYVLEIVSNHNKIMNHKHLIQALRTLFTLQKNGETDLSTNQILKHPQFEKICRYLKSQAGLIELNDTIDALKVMSFVGVPSNSTITQVLLQLIRHNVNNLSLHQIIFLDFILSQFQPTPLVEALLIALPVVFQILLPVQLDKSNPVHLTEFLQYASKKPVSDECLELIVDSIAKCSNNLDVKQAKSIVWSICDLRPDDILEPLLKRAIDVITSNIDKLPLQDVETTITKLSYKYSLKAPFYYDEALFDAYANNIVDNNLGLMPAIFAIQKIGRVFHVNHGLLDYISAFYEEDPDLVLKGPPEDLYCYIHGLSLTEYKPPQWPKVRELILRTSCFVNATRKDVVWLRLASSLCVLDIYKPEVFQKALDMSHLEIIFRKHSYTDFVNLLLLYQVFNTFKPEFIHMLPSAEYVRGLMGNVKPVIEFPLESALQQAVGGKSYVFTDLKTQLGHHIDHAIVMRKGGFPVAINSTSQNLEYIEDLDISPDNQIILILALGHTSYIHNCRLLKGMVALMIKTLEAKGYAVVPICVDEWKSLADFERIPYLMQAIKLKTENYMSMSEAVV